MLPDSAYDDRELIDAVLILSSSQKSQFNSLLTEDHRFDSRWTCLLLNLVRDDMPTVDAFDPFVQVVDKSC